MTDLHLDAGAVLDVVKARAAQQYLTMLDEIARLTVYATQLERRVAELERPPSEGPTT